MANAKDTIQYLAGVDQDNYSYFAIDRTIDGGYDAANTFTVKKGEVIASFNNQPECTLLDPKAATLAKKINDIAQKHKDTVFIDAEAVKKLEILPLINAITQDSKRACRKM